MFAPIPPEAHSWQNFGKTFANFGKILHPFGFQRSSSYSIGPISCSSKPLAATDGVIFTILRHRHAAVSHLLCPTVSSTTCYLRPVSHLLCPQVLPRATGISFVLSISSTTCHLGPLLDHVERHFGRNHSAWTMQSPSRPSSDTGRAWV